MDEDLDRIVDLVTARIRAKLGSAPASGGSPCAGTDGQPSCRSAGCSQCGHCAAKRPDEIRALKDSGASRVGARPGMPAVASDIAALIDHTLLKPEVSSEEITKLCQEARQYGFASVCVNTGHVPRCRSLLAGSPVKVCAVVGFPLGAMAPAAKAFEAREAVRAGADEIDMVINIGALKEGNYALVHDDIRKVVQAAHPAQVKVILETGMLDDEQKVAGSTLSKLAGAHFVKTSTGFGKGGATAADVALMRKVVGRELGVKASGGIHNADDARRLMAAGATRLGASAGVAIVTGGKSAQAY